MIQLILQLLMIVFGLGEPVEENDAMVEDYIECNEVLIEHCTIAFYEC